MNTVGATFNSLPKRCCLYPLPCTAAHFNQEMLRWCGLLKLTVAELGLDFTVLGSI